MNKTLRVWKKTVFVLMLGAVVAAILAYIETKPDQMTQQGQAAAQAPTGKLTFTIKLDDNGRVLEVRDKDNNLVSPQPLSQKPLDGPIQVIQEMSFLRQVWKESHICTYHNGSQPYQAPCPH